MRKLLLMICLLLALPAQARDIFNEAVFNDKGDPVMTGARALVYNYGTTTLATLYTVAGAALAQPVTQDSGGYIVFAADDGKYRIQFYGAGVTPRSIFWSAFDPDEFGAGISSVEDDTTPRLGGDLDVNGSSIVSADGGDIDIQPDGSGHIVLSGMLWPLSSGAAGQVLADDGSGNLSWEDGGVGGAGDVAGPASATNNAVPLFDGTTGKVLKNSTMTNTSGTVGGVSGMTGLAAIVPPTGTGLTVADNSASNVALTLSNAGAGTFSLVVDGTVDGVDVSALGTSEATAIHDATAAEISAITEKATPASGDWLLIEDSESSNVKKKVQVGNLPTGGGGEANTASNVGTGVGIYETKVGIDLRFNSLSSNTTALTITEDDGNDQADFAIADVVAAGAAGLMTGADKTKLNGIEAGADDVSNANVDAAGALMHIDADAKGDLLAATGANAFARLAVGTNTQVLSANSATASGLQWVDATAGTGDVVGPATSTDNAVPTFSGTTGNLIQDTGLTYSAGTLNGAATIICVEEITCDGEGTGLSFTENYATDISLDLSNAGAGDFNITLDGTVDGVDLSAAGITDGYVLTADGAGAAAWEVAPGAGGGISDVVEDTTPQLGGNLDVNGNSIVSAADGNIAITPNGTGNVVLDGLSWPEADGTNGQALTTNGSGTLAFSTIAGGSSAVQWRYKASDTARAEDTTYTADLELDDISLEANSRYEVMIFLLIGVPSATPDIKWRLLNDLGVSSDWMCIGNIDMDGANTAPQDYGAGQDNMTMGLMALTLDPGIGRWHGTIITTTACTFDFEWAQNTSSTDATTLKAGSYIRVEKMN